MKNGLINNEVLESHVLYKDPSDGPIWDKVTCPEDEQLMKDNIKTAFKVTTTHIVTGTVEKSIKEVLQGGHGNQRKAIKELIRNMVEEAWINIV